MDRCGVSEITINSMAPCYHQMAIEYSSRKAVNREYFGSQDLMEGRQSEFSPSLPQRFSPIPGHQIQSGLSMLATPNHQALVKILSHLSPATTRVETKLGLLPLKSSWVAPSGWRTGASYICNLKRHFLATPPRTFGPLMLTLKPVGREASRHALRRGQNSCSGSSVLPEMENVSCMSERVRWTLLIGLKLRRFRLEANLGHHNHSEKKVGRSTPAVGRRTVTVFTSLLIPAIRKDSTSKT